MTSVSCSYFDKNKPVNGSCLQSGEVNVPWDLPFKHTKYLIAVLLRESGISAIFSFPS